MPRYDYKCTGCNSVKEEHRSVDEDHRAPGVCDQCGKVTEFIFPLGGFALWTFEPYYDEALDMDVHSRGEKKQILKSLGLQEAGDKVGGARNFDKDANYVKANQKVSGRTYDHVIKEKELARQAKDWTVGTETGGKTTYAKASQLPAPSPSTKVHGKAKPKE